jgi:hypothetical protein
VKVSIGNYPENHGRDPARYRAREIEVKIDDFDIWNLDSTLAYIIAPALELLKEKQHGAPWVDDDDVPAELRRTAAPTVEDWETDDNHFKRWEWVLDEMIFAFKSKNNDWEDEFLGQSSYLNEEMVKIQHRIQNGYRLFGKYYDGLWD